MTALEIITAARQASNNEGSTFVSDSELYSYLTFGLNEAAAKALIIEATDSSSLTSVADQADYTLPTGFISIKRVEYNNLKLRPSTLVEIDKLQSAISSDPASGTPRHYNLFGDNLKLVPTPDTSSDTIKLYGYKYHDAVSVSTTIAAPIVLHHYFVDYVTYRIYLKEGDSARANDHLTLWRSSLEDMRKFMQERRRRDHFNIVQSEDQSIANTLGLV